MVLGIYSQQTVLKVVTLI